MAAILSGSNANSSFCVAAVVAFVTAARADVLAEVVLVEVFLLLEARFFEVTIFSSPVVNERKALVA